MTTPTNNTGSPTGPAPKQPGVTVSSLWTLVGPRLLLLVVLVASAWLAFAQFTTPAVVPASAPVTEFSAARAMTELPAIAKEPHPMGSPANAAVQAYLIRQITALGLTPEVQTTTVISRQPGSNEFLTGTVHNVIARLKGTASTRAILLDAHYDSAATAPGASWLTVRKICRSRSLMRRPISCSQSSFSPTSPSVADIQGFSILKCIAAELFAEFGRSLRRDNQE